MTTYKDMWSKKLKGVAHVVDPKRLSPGQIAAKAKEKTNDNRHLKIVRESNDNAGARNSMSGDDKLIARMSTMLKGGVRQADKKTVLKAVLSRRNDNGDLFKKRFNENEGSGVPANAVQGGNTAGLGGENGEPGVGKKKKPTWKDAFRRAWDIGKKFEAPNDPALQPHIDKFKAATSKK